MNAPAAVSPDPRPPVPYEAPHDDPDALPDLHDQPDLQDLAVAVCLPMGAPPGAPGDTGDMSDGGLSSDASVFAGELSRRPPADGGLSLDPLARGLAAGADEARAMACQRFDFDLDLPVLGVLQGRVSIANGQAELELRACRPAAAAALRARQSELQRLVERECDGGVSLFIV
jgi:hypothetical protein